MSESAPRANRSFRFALVVLLAVVGGVGGGWLLGKFRVGRSKPASRVDETIPSGHRGRLVFQTYCASCHGPDGRGDGDNAATLHPSPHDFASRPWRGEATREAIRKVTQEGIAGTAMPAFQSTLSHADLDAVTAHVYELATIPASADPNLIRAAGFIELGGVDPPPLTLVDAEGRLVRLPELRGKAVLIHFWGTDCVHCLKEMPALAELEKAHAGRLTVLHVCAAAEEPANAQKTLARLAPDAKCYTDPTGLGCARFETQTLPAVWLLDAHGKAICRGMGAKDWHSAAVQKLLAQVLSRGNHP